MPGQVSETRKLLHKTPQKTSRDTLADIPSPHTAYPYSRGHIHTRGKEWSDGVDFHGGFFTDPNDIDLKNHIWVYKTQREILRRTSLYRGELPIGHPAFSPDSAAACTKLDTPTTNGHNNPNDIQNIEYSASDDEEIIKFIRANVQTPWHSLGTCKMAPREKNGVVDDKLNVYGVSGLKVIDLSIVPENVAANTMSVALMIGEKGAVMIMEELGIGGGRGCDNGLFKGKELAYM